MKSAQKTLAFLSLIIFSSLLIASAAKADNRKNVILIQTDDQSIKTLKSKFINPNGQAQTTMPNVLSQLVAGGVEFTNHYATTPICAPSRTALLAGRYPHTTNVVTNGGAYGGWQGWASSTALNNNFVSRLDQAGYRTAHFGKWTNYYGEEGPKYVPPGWDTWLSDYYDQSTRDFYGYFQNAKIDRFGWNNKILGPFGSQNYQSNKNIDPKSCQPDMKTINSCFYHTDRMTSYAADEIFDSSAKKEPFYIQVDYHTPHGDQVAPAGPQPATRHLDSANKTNVPKGSANPNYNENTDTNPTKPFLVRKNNGPITSRSELNGPGSWWRRSLEALRSVDQGVGYLINALKETGEFNNTYIIFTSDNGFFYGDHRFLSGKYLAYQEAANLPLIISGPGVKKGRTNIPTSTVDIGPTVLDLTDTVPANYSTDGKSIKNVINSPITYPENSTDNPYSKRAQLIEFIDPAEITGNASFDLAKPFALSPIRPANNAPALRYRAIKIGRYKYIEYNKTTDELYDLYLDPEELKNQIKNPAYLNILRYMENNLANYKNCQGQACLVPPAPAPSK